MKDELFRLFNFNDLLELPESVWKILLGDKNKRDEIYKELISLHHGDMSYDWFQRVYEEEFAQRKQHKQDFTPNELGVICSELTGNVEGITHEPTAGTGSMLIANWWVKAKKCLPWDFKPSRNPVVCWELSDRAIPVLLLNLSIRGIEGLVFHGDVLEKNVKQVFKLINENDDPMMFSNIIKTNEHEVKGFI